MNKWVAILLVLALALSACGDEASDDGDTGVSAGADGGQSDGDVADEARPTTLASGLITEFGAPNPIEGAEVCLMDAEPPVCTFSDANGRFELDVPIYSEIALTITKEGLHSTILVFTTSRAGFDAAGVPIAERATTDSFLGSIGLTQSLDKGLIVITAPLSGMTPVIEPASGDEPFYLNGISITHSDTGSPAEGGFAGITNVEPGTVTFHLEHETATCTYSAWGFPGANEVRLPVRAGFLTAPFRPGCTTN
jgi:hypothetical protein